MSNQIKRVYDSMDRKVKQVERETYDSLTRIAVVKEIIKKAVSEGRGDAADLPHAARELEHVFGTTMEAQYPALAFSDQSDPVIPWNTEVPSGARTFTQLIIDGTAEAVFVGLMGSGDLPDVSLLGTEVTGSIENYANQYSYSRREMRGAVMMGMPLEATKAKLAKQGHAVLLHETAAWGKESLNLKGLFNFPNIAIADAADKAAGGTTWEVATPSEIIADINSHIGGVATGSNELYTVDTVLLSGPKLRLLNERTLSGGADGSVTTIMEFVQKAHPGVRFRAINDLKVAASRGNLTEDAMFAFRFDAEFVSLVVPGGMFFEQHPPQEEGLNVRVIGESEIGGVKCEHPLSMARMDGI